MREKQEHCNVILTVAISSPGLHKPVLVLSSGLMDRCSISEPGMLAIMDGAAPLQCEPVTSCSLGHGTEAQKSADQEKSEPRMIPTLVTSEAFAGDGRAHVVCSQSSTSGIEGYWPGAILRAFSGICGMFPVEHFWYRGGD